MVFYANNDNYATMTNALLWKVGEAYSILTVYPYTDFRSVEFTTFSYVKIRFRQLWFLYQIIIELSCRICPHLPRLPYWQT